MDLYKVIRDLQEELQRVTTVIQSLEEMMRSGNANVGSFRGRKPTVQDGQPIVSPRIKKYRTNRGKMRS